MKTPAKLTIRKVMRDLEKVVNVKFVKNFGNPTYTAHTIRKKTKALIEALPHLGFVSYEDPWTYKETEDFKLERDGKTFIIHIFTLDGFSRATISEIVSVSIPMD